MPKVRLQICYAFLPCSRDICSVTMLKNPNETYRDQHKEDTCKYPTNRPAKISANKQSTPDDSGLQPASLLRYSPRYCIAEIKHPKLKFMALVKLHVCDFNAIRFERSILLSDIISHHHSPSNVFLVFF